jgi:hypothetical protein
LGGVLASNGLKDKQNKSEYEKAIESVLAVATRHDLSVIVEFVG